MALNYRNISLLFLGLTAATATAAAITLNLNMWAPELGVELHAPLILLSATCLGAIFLGLGLTGQQNGIAKGFFGLHALSLLSAAITLSICIWAPEASMSLYAPLVLVGISCLSLLGLGIALIHNDQGRPRYAANYQPPVELTTTALTPTVYYKVEKYTNSERTIGIRDILDSKGSPIQNCLTGWNELLHENNQADIVTIKIGYIASARYNKTQSKENEIQILCRGRNSCAISYKEEDRICVTGKQQNNDLYILSTTEFSKFTRCVEFMNQQFQRR